MTDTTSSGDEPLSIDEPLALASVFPPASVDDWRAELTRVLERSGRKIADPAHPEATIQVDLPGGISVDPLYFVDDDLGAGDSLPGSSPFTRGSTSDGTVEHGWDVRALFDDPDPARTKAAIEQDLENGVSSLWLKIGEGALSAEDLPTVLDEVLLDLCPVILDAGPLAEDALAGFVKTAMSSPAPRDQIQLNLGLDPIGHAAKFRLKVDASELAGLIREALSVFPSARMFTVDSTVYADAGAHDVQELAFSLGTGVAYLRLLVDSGYSVDQALELIDFRYAIADDQFVGIAKLRAARALWSQVALASGASPSHRGQVQHAVTSRSMFTKRDPWVNLLRGTVSCFAAATGGAESITVLPFDVAAGIPDQFSRRIARNTQAVLHDESNIGRVIDPAGGSPYVESLTNELATKAWALFQQLEAQGEMAACVDSGVVHAWVAESEAERRTLVAHRKEPLTGLSEFPNLAEPPLERVAGNELPTPADGLPLRTKGREFELFRDTSDAYFAKHGSRPTVYLAALGPVAAHTARENFAANLLNSGGIATVKGPVASSPESSVVTDIAEGLASSGTSVACIVSSDALYGEQGDALIAALREAGASSILLAGRADRIDGLSQTVELSLYMGCDVAMAIREVYSTLDVAIPPLDGSSEGAQS